MDVTDNAQAQTSTSVDLNVLYKKWHRAGFISVGYWPEADRIFVEIGSTDKDSGKLITATKCFVPVTQLLSYLYAEVHNTMPIIYPDFPNQGHAFYGGGMVDGRPVSRVFKLSYWTSNNVKDPTSRAFKCGHFEGVRTASGAIKPEMTKAISVNSIKMSLLDISDLYQTLHVAVLAQRTAAMLSLSNVKSS